MLHEIEFYEMLRHLVEYFAIFPQFLQEIVHFSIAHARKFYVFLYKAKGFYYD